MATTLSITSDSTSSEVNFISAAANYRITAWSPAVANPVAGDFGRSPYADAVEEMEIVIGGSDPLANLELLKTLMDQSERFARGENVDFVKIQYQPTSGSDVMQAIVLGPDGDAPMIELPVNFVNSPVVTKIDPVILRFRRSGLWVGTNNIEVETGTAANNPAVITSSGWSSETLLPAPLVFTTTGAENRNWIFWDSFMLFASGTSSTQSANKIVLINAESLAIDVWTSVADSANNAVNTNVLRYTPVGTSEALSNVADVSASANANVRRWGVWASYRNNSGTTSWKVRFRLETAGRRDHTPIFHVPAGTSDPAWAYFGSVVLGGALTDVSVAVQASAASGTFDIDTIVLHAMDDPATSKAIAILQPEGVATATITEGDMVIHHQLDTSLTPIIYTNSDINQSLAYGGNPTLFMRGDFLSWVWLATGHAGGGGTNDWRRINSNGTTVASVGFSATRYLPFLTPK